MRPELSAKHKITALNRRKSLLDALIDFIQTHPNVSSEAVLKPVYNKTALYFFDTAIIKPFWVKDKIVLRLEKYTEDLSFSDDYDPFDSKARVVCKDVSKMSENKLVKILNKLYKELHLDDDS